VTEIGVRSGISDVEYHADKGSLSSSGARLLLPPSCPAKFREVIDNPPKPKREFDFGHAAHRLVLGAGAELVEIDAPDYRGKDAREARDKAHADGNTPVLTAELATARRMADVVHDDPVARPLFADGHAELSLYFDDPESGVRLRARPDWMTTRHRLIIVDFKTSVTANPKLFARKAADYGYHQQAAWYIDAVAALGLDWHPAFVFVVQEKEPPFLVSVVELDADAIAEGRRLNREAIRIYAACMLADEWPGYTDRITPISLPPWAFQTQTINDLLIND
jgi:hypothetical protein